LCRNPRHIAPERLQIDSVLGPAGDFYALGSVMFEAIAGRFPFPHETIPELLLKVVGGHGIEPEPDWPPVFTQILRELLEPDPELRLTSHAELRARLRGVLDTR
jgi:serine/threonine-protein kinase